MSLTWEASEGAEGVYYAHAGRYTARIVEGRVWRWQVGDDNEPARMSGRTTRGMSEAQEACALAVRMLELSDAGADVEGLPTSSGKSDDWRDGYAAGADASEERIRTDETVSLALGSLETALREVVDRRDQIGERDGVIAQLRASLDALQARYDERGAKILEVIADNDALRGVNARITVGDREITGYDRASASVVVVDDPVPARPVSTPFRTPGLFGVNSARIALDAEDTELYGDGRGLVGVLNNPFFRSSASGNTVTIEPVDAPKPKRRDTKPAPKPRKKDKRSARHAQRRR